jgi:hypothetical protein
VRSEALLKEVHVSWKRLVGLFVAMSVAGFLVHATAETLHVDVHVRSGAAYFAMAMAAWLVARDYIRKNLLLGRSFTTWLFGTLAAAILVNILLWRFWPR